MTMKLLKVNGMCYLVPIYTALNQIEPMYDDLEMDYPCMPFQNLSYINTS